MNQLGVTSPRCLGCGRSIPDSVSRVLGDNDGNVPACPSCDPTPFAEGRQWHKVVQDNRAGSRYGSSIK